ncbi:MAG TPA: hypothetical protein VMB50_04635 [Myxococcales bacterium]|nr:hypothetical protein [Myxococcales bacterium]
MRAFVPALAVAVLGFVAEGCNVTPQEQPPPPTSGGAAGGNSGGCTTRCGNNGSSTGSEGNGASSSSTGGSGSTGGTTGAAASSSGSGSTGGSASAGTTSGGSTGAPDGGPLTVGGVTFVSVSYPTEGTNGSAAFLGVNYNATYTINPVATFLFRVEDPTGKIGVPKTPVTFSINTATQQIGASLVASSQCTAVGSNGTSAGPCLSDDNGEVTIVLASGHYSGGVTVTASVTLSDGSVASAQGVSNVVGTQPSVATSTLICSPVNLPAFVGSGGDLPCASQANQTGLQTTCTIKLADRFNNPIGVVVSVQFFTEAGTWVSDQVQTGQTIGQTTLPLNEAQNTLSTSGLLPEEVTPLGASAANPTGEPSYTGTCSGVPWVYCPRDGLVTIVAVFTGEEPFTDHAGTGYWEPGDAWVDMPTPFVDSNDNSVWDPGEFCFGGAQGICPGPNHQWDGDDAVWIETRVVFTGDPLVFGNGGPQISNWFSPASTGTNSFTVAKGAPITGHILWADMNMNMPAGATTDCDTLQSSQACDTLYGVTMYGSSCSTAPTVTYQGPSGAGGDALGLDFARFGLPASGNPDCDAGYYVDDAGAQVANPYCTFLTSISDFSGGFGVKYQVSESSTCNTCTPTPPATSCTPPPGTVSVVSTAASNLVIGPSQAPAITGTAL